MYYVYVLYSLDFERTYTGLTQNIEKRFYQHNAKQNKSTKAYVPWEMLYDEKFKTRIEARTREKYLKSGIGREFIKIIINRPRGATRLAARQVE